MNVMTNRRAGERNYSLLQRLGMLVLLWIWMSIMHSVALAQDTSVRAELSSSTITRDESVVLTITAVGVDAELDASSLGTDFDVVNSSSSRQVMSVTGANNRLVNTNVVQWTLELYPKGLGVFTIPSVKVGEFETQLLSLTVNDVPQGAQRDIFLEASVDTTSPWVQSQVVMSLKVFQAVEIVDGGLDSPAGDDLVVERIGEDRRRQEVRDGREYSVTERRFALFPQKSGTVTIESVALSVSIPADANRVRGFFSPTRKLTRRSDPITLDVQARPPSGSAWWLPARQLILQSQWQGDPESVQVDQPLTRTLIMRAEGVLDSQLPTINVPAIEGLSLYAEEPVLAMGPSDDSIVAEQRINWALIPQRSGELILPEVSVEWFNTITGEIEVTKLPAETINVLPAASVSSTGGDSAGTPVPQNNAVSNGNALAIQAPDSLTDQASFEDSNALSPATNEKPGSQLSIENTALFNDKITHLESSIDRWRIVALAIVVLWLLTTLAWWIQRRRTKVVAQGSVDAASASGGKMSLGGSIDTLRNKLAPMGDIEKSCQQGSLPDIKRSLLAWSEHQWPEDKPVTLDALQARLPDGEASRTLSKIQLALYSKSGSDNEKTELKGMLKTLASDLKSALLENNKQEELDSVNGAFMKNGAASGSPHGLPRL